MAKNHIREMESELLAEYAAQAILEEAIQDMPLETPYLDRPHLDYALRGIMKTKARTQRLCRRAAHSLRYAAALGMVMISVFAVLYTQVDAFRHQVLTLFIREDVHYISYAVEADLKDAGFAYAPSYFPEGFTDSSIVETPHLKQLMVLNVQTEQVIFFEQHDSSTSNVFLDSETEEETVILKGFYEGKLHTDADKGVVLFWPQDNYFYKLEGEALTAQEAIKIAESLVRL